MSGLRSGRRFYVVYEDDGRTVDYPEAKRYHYLAPPILCPECKAEVVLTKNVLLNVPPDGATMQEWACLNGHTEFRELR